MSARARGSSRIPLPGFSVTKLGARRPPRSAWRHPVESNDQVELASARQARTECLWTVLDFKTDATVDDQQQYAAQLRLYCAAVSAATGEDTRAVLLSV